MSQDQTPVSLSKPGAAPPTSVPAPRDAQWNWTPTVPVQRPPYQQPPYEQPPAQWPPEQQPRLPQPVTWSRAMVLAVVFAVVVLLAGGGVGWWLWHRSDDGAPLAPAASGQAGTASQPGPQTANGTLAGGATAPRTAVPPSPHTAPAPDPQAQALAQLSQLRQRSLARVALDGRWVAQVASKSVGITDPLQTAQNGTHTFYATDILAESVAAQKLVDDPSEVYVLWGTDFGKRSQAPDGNPYWVTVVDAGFGGSTDVQQWCRSSFPTLNQQQLADTCAPRQLSPPHN